MADTDKENRCPNVLPLSRTRYSSFRRRYPRRCRINVKRKLRALPKHKSAVPCKETGIGTEDLPAEKRGRFLKTNCLVGDNRSNSHLSRKKEQDEIHIPKYEHRAPSEYSVGKLLGRGKFGRVYRATQKFEPQRVVALKVLQKKQVAKCSNSPFLLRREVEIHCRLHHPNILHQYGYVQDSKAVYLVFEEAPGGDLYKYMKQNRLSETVASTCIRQVAAALAHLQKLHVSHRDVKPENILLTRVPQDGKDGQEKSCGHFKLCDFGWAVHAPFPKHHMRGTFCGTPEYLAPEMLIRSSSSNNTVKAIGGKSSQGPLCYDCRFVDAWTLGVLAYEIVFGQTPFVCTDEERSQKIKECGGGNHVNQKQFETGLVFDKIRRYGTDKREKKAIFDSCDKGEKGVVKEICFVEFRDLVQELLRVVPSSRMSVGDVGEHPWIVRACLR